MLHLVYAFLCPVFYFTVLASKYVDVGVMLVRLVFEYVFLFLFFLFLTFIGSFARLFLKNVRGNSTARKKSSFNFVGASRAHRILSRVTRRCSSSFFPSIRSLRNLADFLIFKSS